MDLLVTNSYCKQLVGKTISELAVSFIRDEWQKNLSANDFETS